MKVLDILNKLSVDFSGLSCLLMFFGRAVCLWKGFRVLLLYIKYGV